MDDPDLQETAMFLLKSANSLSTTCPAASRYYLSTLSRHVGSAELRSFVKYWRHCNHCGSLFGDLNCKIRIQPIPPPNCHIKKLLKLEKGQPWKLNNRQKKKLKKYKESTNKIIYTCNVCKKTKTFEGLKKYSARLQEINTPVQKIKFKKGDLNAGLFIKTQGAKEQETSNELESNIQDDCQNEVTSQPSSTPELIYSSTKNDKPQTIHFTPEILKKSVTPQVSTSSKKKRKKGLLAQILNQEQEAKRQKKTLSSFLTAL